VSYRTLALLVSGLRVRDYWTRRLDYWPEENSLSLRWAEVTLERRLMKMVVNCSTTSRPRRRRRATRATGSPWDSALRIGCRPPTSFLRGHRCNRKLLRGPRMGSTASRARSRTACRNPVALVSARDDCGVVNLGRFLIMMATEAVRENRQKPVLSWSTRAAAPRDGISGPARCTHAWACWWRVYQ